jgi:leucyl aminopeptidase
MDFRNQVITASAVARTDADALMVVIAGARLPALLPRALAQPLDAAVKQHDLVLKAGRALYAGRLAGVKAPRTLFAVAADGSAKAIKSAAAQGLSTIKGLGVKHLAVWLAGVDAVSDAHAEALTSAVGDAVYLYRHTKPSAGPASRLVKVTLLSGADSAAGVGQGLRR